MKAGVLTEILPGIFRITERGALGILKPPVHIYVITGSNGLVFDAGYGDFFSIRKFKKAYKEIERICAGRGEKNSITRILLSHAHADHFSGLRRLRRKFRFRIILTDGMLDIIRSGSVYRASYAPAEKKERAGVSSIPFRIFGSIMRKLEYAVYSLYWGISFVPDPDMVIAPESVITINSEVWRIFRSPGHSGEHITLYNEKRGVLFSGDNVLNSINVWLGPPKSDIDGYETSMKKMLSLKGLEIILPAHGSPVLKPYERLNEIIAWRRKRTGDILAMIRDAFPAGISIMDILHRLYPSAGSMKRDFARGWVELTLQKLEREKLIGKDGGKYFTLV